MGSHTSMGDKALPIGVDRFKEMRNLPFYYVDKTGFLYEILKARAKVNLITRPRRFGKSLNLDMMRQFLSIGSDPKLFEGLAISAHEDICREFQGKWPVLFLDLKSVEGPSFEKSCAKLRRAIQNAAETTRFLLTSPVLSDSERDEYRRVLTMDRMPRNTLSEQVDFEEMLEEAPSILLRLLSKHFGSQVVVLIDEYDTALNNAYHEKFYDRMIVTERGMLHGLLKGNDYLKFAVLTGCLRISRESIFTGMNNLSVWNDENGFDGEYFGFTEQEVQEMLAYFGIEDKLDIIRDWYDGYCFGKKHVYCPWDVLSYVSQCVVRSGSDKPQNFWVNTSGNDILKDLLSKADINVQKDYTALMYGHSIRKTITRELTFADLDNSKKKPTVLWSMMVASGYLTVKSVESGLSEIAAPNREVRWLLSDSLHDWLCLKYRVSEDAIVELCNALEQGKPDEAQSSLNTILSDMIEARAKQKKKKQREDLYQGILLGLLRQNWIVHAEVQSGAGYVDVSFWIDAKHAVVVEAKDAAKITLEHGCRDALDQIRANNYADAFLKQGAEEVLCYGIAFKGKVCRVELMKQDNQGQ